MDILKMKYPYYKIIISESEANALATLHETMKEFCGNQVCNTCPSKDSPLCNLFNLSDFNTKLDSHKLKGEHTLVHSYDSIRQKADKKSVFPYNKVEGHCTYGRLCPKTGGSCRTCSFYEQQPDNKKEDKEPDKEPNDKADVTVQYNVLKGFHISCMHVGGDCDRCGLKGLCWFPARKNIDNLEVLIPITWVHLSLSEENKNKRNDAIHGIMNDLIKRCQNVGYCPDCLFYKKHKDKKGGKCIFEGLPKQWRILENRDIINKFLGKETNTDVDKQPET